MSNPGYPPPHQNYYAQQPPQPPQPQQPQQSYPQTPSAIQHPYPLDPAYSYGAPLPPTGYPVDPASGLFPYDPAAQYSQPAYETGTPYDPTPAVPYGYPRPIDRNLGGPSGLPSDYIGSYNPSVSPIPAPISYGQYPQQQAYLPHPSISPSLPQTSQSSTAFQSLPQAPGPSAPPTLDQPKPDVASPAPKAIKIKFKNPSQSTPPRNAEMPTRRDSHNSYSAEQYSATSGRHMRSTRAAATSYKEPGSDESEDEVKPRAGRSKSGRSIKPPSRYAEPDEDDFENSMMTSPAVPATTTRSSRSRKRIVDPDEEDEEEAVDDVPEDEDEEFTGSPVAPRLSFPGRPTRSSLAQAQLVPVQPEPEAESLEPVSTGRRSTRANGQRAKSRHSSADGESYHGTESESVSGDDDDDDDLDDFRGARRPTTTRGGRTSRRDSFVVEDDDDYGSPPPRAKKQTRRAPTRAAGRVTRNSTRQHDTDDEQPRKRNLRERANVVNYALPPADITAEMAAAGAADLRAVTESGPKRGGGGGRIGGSLTLRGVGMGFKLPGPPGRDVPQAMGDPDSSDSELDVAGPMKAGAGGGGMVSAGGAPTAAKIQGPSDVPNFGRYNPKSSTADADPLGVDLNITFDNVGGLDGHINQLKEMVALPLLYPELFQQFGVTPPRGVLFHGPPGTGKTLLARALAASCSNGNTKISFFMRKGADVLSKWVGEAERQLRMLFEEARAAQPSIIFFDEIDGLAPVRSAKQDQIHASLVSTLLALMDGMDGRGQVIVIGATNRPDSVDPALRRPGRFDREFYFPLPNREARKKIIGINTRKWTPGLSDERLDHLAGLTKGYGGADLRALCTEAALNAIQRRYPQIYSSTDRLLLNPDSITVGAKDFMMSVKKIIPSSARSTASAASQLPPHLVPILAAPLETVKAAVDKALPRHKQKSALEEAEFEDEIGDDLQKHMMVQSLDTMRTYRPRVLIHGPHGMGQVYIGPAILHHLEGFHVQTLDLGTIVGDSTRTPEATLVQLFVEAKRHQPSVLYIPSLTAFIAGIPDTARTTFKSLLDSIPSADQVLLLAIQDGSLETVPRDVRKWFGVGKEGKVALVGPNLNERETYFAELVESFMKPPTAFPDALPRRKRVLEVLPLAPPLPPRQPTEAEIERELQRDKSAQNMMQHSFVTQIPDLMRKYAKASKEVKETALAEYHRLVAAAEAEANQEPVTGDVLPGLELVHPVIGLDGQVVSASTLPQTLDTVPLPNGVGTAPIVQVNGLDAYPSAQDSLDVAPAGLVSAPASQPLPVVDDLTSRQGSRQPSVEPTQLTTQPVPGSVPDATLAKTIESIWKPNDIDMEDVYRKFFNYKYHTPQMLMDDIRLIKDNADRVGTPAQVSLLSAMVSSLNLWIDDFDKRWDPEFVRLKERMEMFERQRKERKEERRKARAAADATAANVTTTDVANDASATATAIESTGQLGAGGGSGVGEKRPRDDLDPDVPDAKRSRSDAMDLDLTANPSAAVQGIAQGTSAPASGDVPSVPPPQAAPPTIHPPFVCPTDALASLSAELRHSTSSFNVDQLEQLRAGVYDLLWRRRSEWDRTEVIQQARDWVGEFEREVAEFMEDSE